MTSASGVDRLFQAPLDAFTRERNELAANTKRAGDAAEAARIKALAKPSVSAWAVNQLYWKARKPYDALMRAGDHLRDVQRAVLEGRRGDLRQASEARQEALVTALDRAVALAADAGHPDSPALRQRLTKTLEALAAYGGQPPDVTPGQLTKDLDPPGFSALAGLANFADLPAPREAPSPKAQVETKQQALEQPSRARVLPHDRELARKRLEHAEAEREAKRLRARAERAAAARRQATERAKATKEDVEEAERTLERARERARKAADDLREAEKAGVAAERAADEADAAVVKSGGKSR